MPSGMAKPRRCSAAFAAWRAFGIHLFEARLLALRSAHLGVRFARRRQQAWLGDMHLSLDLSGLASEELQNLRRSSPSPSAIKSASVSQVFSDGGKLTHLM